MCELHYILVIYSKLTALLVLHASPSSRWQGHSAKLVCWRKNQPASLATKMSGSLMCLLDLDFRYPKKKKNRGDIFVKDGSFLYFSKPQCRWMTANSWPLSLVLTNPDKMGRPTPQCWDEMRVTATPAAVVWSLQKDSFILGTRSVLRSPAFANITTFDFSIGLKVSDLSDVMLAILL